MVALLLEFVGLASVIVVAGSFLTKYADALGERLKLGRTLAGLVLLAAATSLPELAVDCSAALIPAPDIAVGDLFGSCLFNLLILAVLDLTFRPRGGMLSRTAAAHALSATMSVVLVGLAVLSLLLKVDWELLRLSPGVLAIGVVYLLGLRLVYFDQQFATLQIERHSAVAAAAEGVPVAVVGVELHPHMSLSRAIMGYLAATAAILAAAPLLAQTADSLAEATRLGGTFVGTTLVAVTTSLPEIVTTLAAVRMGAFDLAIGNIFGSNSFNMFILVAVDLFYDGPLLANVSATHSITAVSVMLVSSVATLGLLYRAEKRYWILEPDAALIVVMVLGALGLVYAVE